MYINENILNTFLCVFFGSLVDTHFETGNFHFLGKLYGFLWILGFSELFVLFSVSRKYVNVGDISKILEVKVGNSFLKLKIDQQIIIEQIVNFLENSFNCREGYIYL